MNGPLSPDELAEIDRARSYYGGNASNMSSAAAPAPPPEAAYFGPPAAAPPPPAGPAPYAPMLAANNPSPAPPPAPPPAEPKPFPAMMAANNPPPAPAEPSGRHWDPASASYVWNEPPAAAAPAVNTLAPVTVEGVPTRRAGGAPADPYGVKAANAALFGSYGEQKAGIGHAATAEGARAVERSEQSEQLARRMQEDAAIDHAQTQVADQQFAEHMQETQRQIDDLREKKIDPTRSMKDKGLGILAIVGGVIGGIYQGAAHANSNPFLDELHGVMSRDIDAQKTEIENGRAAVQDRLNLYGQLRATYKDSQLADMQARNLMYEATKQEIDAEAGRYDDPLVKARAEQAIASVNHEQALLQKQIADQARAQAAAAASQQMAQVKAARERLDTMYTNTYDKALAAGLPPERAEYEARRVVETLMGGGAGARSQQGPSADPLANVPKPQQEAAVKELEAEATADSAKATLRAAFRKYAALPSTSGPWDRERAALKATMMGAYKQALGPGMSSDKDAETFLEPLMPQYGSSDALNAQKQALIDSQIDSKVATPILDRHNPGRRGPPPVQHFGPDGRPK